MAKMTKTRLRELLAEKRVFNTWEFVGKGGVYITRRARESRSCMVPSWVVNANGFDTDPDAGWYDHGCKTFTISSRDGAVTSLVEAKVWAGTKYDIKEWTLSPYGDWMSKVEYEQRVAEILG